MDEDGARFDSGFDGNGPFRVTPEAGGVSLESALRDFGPAAIDDLIPRLRAIAHLLDAAHTAGHVHGALHPSKVIVHDDATSLTAGSVPIAPYAAPETADGTATPASDQFALAAIAYEWLFGRPIDHPADRPVEVRTMPGVDRVALSKAFTRALAPDPAARFASCTEFCSAVANAVTPELPLLALEPEHHEDPVPAFVPQSPIDPSDLDVRPPVNVEASKIIVDESRIPAGQPELDAIAADAATNAPVPSWNPSVSTEARSMESPRFGPAALFFAVIVGAVFGFAAGYLARPRALQSGPPQTIRNTAGTENTVATASKAPDASASAPSAPEELRRDKPAAPTSVGRLLIRSTPSGASVSVDGVAKGVTPLALRDLATGTLNIVVARRGYIPETHKIVITPARPARSLDVRLAAEATAAVVRPTTPATLGKPAVATGSLNVDSRPTGAGVAINGKPSGNTPLTINDLAPGEYRIVMTMTGYRNFATTVRVVAGERARAAASLTAQE